MEEINLRDETMPRLMKRWEKKLKRGTESKNAPEGPLPGHSRRRKGGVLGPHWTTVLAAQVGINKTEIQEKEDEDVSLHWLKGTVAGRRHNRRLGSRSMQ